MVKDMRDMALSDMENELAKAEVEFSKLRSEARRFVHNPIEALLLLAKGMLESKKKSNISDSQ